MYKLSENPQVLELTKTWKKRSIDLTILKAITVILPNETKKRYCAWCTQGELHHGNQKYCKAACSENAMAWAYPQKEHGLFYLLERQEWKCNVCKHDYGNSWVRDGIWGSVRRLKAIVSKERRPEVDHIVPVAKGGTTLGLSNLQILCFLCHKAKTKIDNSGPKSKVKI